MKPRKRPRSSRYPVTGFIQELKYKDTDVATTTVAVAGTIISQTLVNLAVGTAENNRIGREVKIQSLSINGYLKLLADNVMTDASDIVRIVVFLDRQPNQTAATIAEIFEDADINTFKNLDLSKRFKILSNQVFQLEAKGSQGDGTTIGTQVSYVPYKFHKKLNMLCLQSPTGSGVGLIQTNNIGIAGFSILGSSSFTATARIRYHG